VYRKKHGQIRDGLRIEFGKSKSDLKGLGVLLSGKWQQDENKITTSDPDAQITVDVRGIFLAVVAQPQARPPLYGKLLTEIDDQPVIALFSDEDVVSSEGTSSVAELHAGWFYRLVKDIPSDAKKIALLFPEANEVAVSIFSIQFGSSTSTQS
jgi:hypothetical protein